MDRDPVHEQEQFECFGLPRHVQVECDGSIAPVPPGWGRRDWFLRETTLVQLGAEAEPSPPMTAPIVLEIVR